MKMMDRLGNELHAGNVYHFKPIDAPVVMLEVTEPKDGGPGRLRLEVQIPFMSDKPGQDVAFPELMQVHHPQAVTRVEQAIEDIMNGKTKPSHTLRMPKRKEA